MSAGGAFGGARGYQPKPPEKGVFPLDHFGECKSVSCDCFTPAVSAFSIVTCVAANFECTLQVKEAYLECLKQNANRANACEELSRQYLKCRMER